MADFESSRTASKAKADRRAELAIRHLRIKGAMADFEKRSRTVSAGKPTPAKKPESKPAPAKKPESRTASKAKAAGIVAAGGGPENPAADIAALALYKKSRKDAKAAKGAGPDTASKRLLLVEFLVCFVILGAGTVVAPTGSQDGVPRLMVRGTGLCVLFLVLSLVASAGAKPAKAAAGLGALVTAGYLFTSTDATNLFKWMGGYFSKTGVVTPLTMTADATTTATEAGSGESKAPFTPTGASS